MTVYRVVRVDFWEYRHPTGHVFEDMAEAAKKAMALQFKSMDPLSCYVITPEETGIWGKEHT